MFALRIHSVDAEGPVTGPPSETAVAAANPSVVERRGITHLFRGESPEPPPSAPTSSQQNPSCRSSLLFVVAVPNYLSPDAFLRFCSSHLDHASKVLILRNDAMEDRYSVLITLVDQSTADDFYCDFNGRRFPPAEAEVCHILYVHSVEYTELAEMAGTPPAGYTELPTCPICLERLDQDTSGIINTPCDHSFQCSCVSKWTYLSCQVCQFCQQQSEKPSCSVCGTSLNLWACLICGFVGCGRYKEGHAIRHWKDTKHCYSLDLEMQQVWDYVGDSYVHRLNQSKVDCKLMTTDFRCFPFQEDCDVCRCSEEDSGISGALFSSKVEAIADEYNRLLATQLETQRQYYESLLFEAKSKKENSFSEVVEKAVNEKMQDFQYKLEKCIDEKNSVADLNRSLVKDQELWRERVKEAVEREISALKLRDAKIQDLQEQIRDLTVYIEAQKTLDNMGNLNDIKEGTVLPVPVKQSSPATTKRGSKSNRRRN